MESCLVWCMVSAKVCQNPRFARVLVGEGRRFLSCCLQRVLWPTLVGVRKCLSMTRPDGRMMQMFCCFMKVPFSGQPNNGRRKCSFFVFLLQNRTSHDDDARDSSSLVLVMFGSTQGRGVWSPITPNTTQTQRLFNALYNAVLQKIHIYYK